MKKILSILIAVAILIASVTAITVYAQTDENRTELPVGVYPESEHDYPNDFEHTWVYTHPTEAEGLFVTFSEESSLDEEEHEVPDGDGYWITYDEMTIMSNSHRENRYHFYDDEFSGRTFYLDGNSFSISLSTDSEGTDYGFSIDRISHLPPENETMIRYHYYDSEKVDKYELFGNDEAKIIMSSSPSKHGYAFSGWSTEYGGKPEYFYSDTLEKGKAHDLYAVWTKLQIEPEDSFRFSNSAIGWNSFADGKYYFTDEHYDMMIGNFFKTFGLGPIPGPIAAAVLSTLPSWDFTGSCYGMAASVFLNYYDAAEFIPATGAENLSEVRLSPEVVSMVNYYQAQAASSYLCENVAAKPGTAVYSEQIKRMYETVKNGSPALLTYYKGEYLIDMGHTVTLTGAFEDAYGNKYLVAYDSNLDYNSGECHYFRISPDFKEIYRCLNTPTTGYETMYYDDVAPVTGFNWTADYEQFTAFDINGEGNPLVWYKIFFGHIVYWMSTVFSAVFNA